MWETLCVALGKSDIYFLVDLSHVFADLPSRVARSWAANIAPFIWLKYANVSVNSCLKMGDTWEYHGNTTFSALVHGEHGKSTVMNIMMGLAHVLLQQRLTNCRECFLGSDELLDQALDQNFNPINIPFKWVIQPISGTLRMFHYWLCTGSRTSSLDLELSWDLRSQSNRQLNSLQCLLTTASYRFYP